VRKNRRELLLRAKTNWRSTFVNLATHSISHSSKGTSCDGGNKGGLFAEEYARKMPSECSEQYSVQEAEPFSSKMTADIADSFPQPGCKQIRFCATIFDCPGNG
jgi:hypothetical protein